jgi:hypothetical protein
LLISPLSVDEEEEIGAGAGLGGSKRRGRSRRWMKEKANK